ncbi:MAG: AMP-binding protein [Candidatus Binatia bacterium]|nr:AMP-binding protein [Candidatus Binatia bacterium]
MTERGIEARTLGDLILRAADRWGDREVLVFPDQRVTYAELLRRSNTRARSLASLGIGPGDHVGILAPNLVEVVELLFGIALCGAVAVPINARYKTRELAYVIENADLKVLFTTTRIADYVDFVELLQGALPELLDATDPLTLTLSDAPLLRTIVLLEDLDRSGLIGLGQFDTLADSATDEAVRRRAADVSPEDPCVMMYTSGTTANPKGCRLSHDAITRNAGAVADRFEMTEVDRQWNPLPMFHMSAYMPLLAQMRTGGSFVTDTHFEPDAAFDAIEAEKPTILFTAFPTIMGALTSHPRFRADALPQVRLINNVAPPAQLRENMQLIPQATHISAYGLTEASGICCFGSRHEDDETRATTSGRPFDGVSVRIVDPETSAEAATGTTGEMTLKGFSLFEGYYKSPEKTAEVFDDGGWFHTGDLCSVDANGFVSYHGRIKDMLKVGGENVAALEVESFLTGHPAVQLVQVVGVPDAKLLEVVAAFLQLHPGAACTEDDILTYCKGKIASFKIPRHIRFVTEWPMSATKIQKYRLREMIGGDVG